MYHHFGPLAKVLAGVPFTTGGLQNAHPVASDKRLRVVGLQGKTCVYLWISDSEATWSNLALKKITPNAISAASLTVEGLEPGTYRVQWWDTWKGGVITQQDVRAASPKLEIKVPTFTRDIACKIFR